MLIDKGFCEECGKTGDFYEMDGICLCPDCEEEYIEAEEEWCRTDPQNYCLKCSEYSEILDRGKCPMCFEVAGYI